MLMSFDTNSIVTGEKSAKEKFTLWLSNEVTTGKCERSFSILDLKKLAKASGKSESSEFGIIPVVAFLLPMMPSMILKRDR